MCENKNDNNNLDIKTELKKINERLDKVEESTDKAIKESKYAVDKVLELRDQIEFGVKTDK